MSAVIPISGSNPADKRPDPTSRNIEKRFLLQDLGAQDVSKVIQTLMAITSGDHARRTCAFNEEVGTAINGLRNHDNKTVRDKADLAMRRIIKHGPPGSNLWFR